MRKERAIVLDVETAGNINLPKVYDLGFAVIERKGGKILSEHSYIIPEIFWGCQKNMKTAYYADKIPQYCEGLANDIWKVKPFMECRTLIADIMREEQISKVYAYNCRFDRDALAHTAHILSEGAVNTFFPDGTKFCDIWRMACETIMLQTGFAKFCVKHGFVSPAGNLRTSAEVCYAYINNRPDFAEHHTGLDDVMIENAILQYCFKQKKTMGEDIIAMPWKIPNKKFKLPRTA
jgi:hypothetical protein